MGGNELHRAKRLLRRKKYTEIIRILEPQVFRFRQSPDFYYLLGTAYFYTGDKAGAATYLRRVLDLRKEHIATMLQLAAIELQRGDNPKAIELWLQVLEIDPKNKYAKKGLELLRKGSNNPQIVANFIENNRFTTLVAKKKNFFPVFLAGIIVLFFLIPLVFFLLNNKDISVFEREIRNEDIQSLEIEQNGDIVDLHGEYRYILTEKEIPKLLDEAKEQFNKYRDNDVQIIVNRLKYSNAAQSIKDKAILLESYLKAPDFTNFEGEISFEDIRNDPMLYENCYVRWKGKISNLQIHSKEIRFDFLVGYHDNKVLEGIIPVVFDFAVSLEQGDPVEIIGKIVKPLTNLHLQGTSIRPIAPGTDL